MTDQKQMRIHIDEIVLDNPYIEKANHGAYKVTISKEEYDFLKYLGLCVTETNDGKYFARVGAAKWVNPDEFLERHDIVCIKFWVTKHFGGEFKTLGFSRANIRYNSPEKTGDQYWLIAQNGG